jgi:hypothetical protein
MIINTWSQVLTDSFEGLGRAVIYFLPNIIIAILIVILGWRSARFSPGSSPALSGPSASTRAFAAQALRTC